MAAMADTRTTTNTLTDTPTPLPADVITRLSAIGISTDDWQDAGASDTSDLTMCLRLYFALCDSLAEMKRLAGTLAGPPAVAS
jgi:hypothetical protein